MNRNERLITRTLIIQASEVGWTLFRVHDGDHEFDMDDIDKVIAMGCNLSNCRLDFKHSDPDQSASAWLIFGNGNVGFDVISDYTSNLRLAMVKVDEYVAQLELEWHGSGVDGLQSKIAEIIAKDKLELAAPHLLPAVKVAITLADCLIHTDGVAARGIACQFREQFATSIFLATS